jgi:outer membrane protein assembly factor BamB
MQSPPSPSYLAGFDKQTGEPVWNVRRELDAPKEAAQSYTSPMLAEVDGRPVIAVLGADHLTLHAAEDGEELGRLGGFNPEQNGFFRSIASPVIAGNVIVCPYARGESLTAVDMSKLIAGAGEQAILWRHYDLGADVPTPCVRDGRVYLLRDRGNVVCLDVKTGETIWTYEAERNRTTYSSSPLIAGDHLYLVREDARVFVLKLRGEEPPELVATNTLSESRRGRAGADFTVASPVPVDGGLLFRTSSNLIRVDR